MTAPRLYITVSPNGVERVEADSQSPEITEAAMRLHRGITEALIKLNTEARSATVWGQKDRNSIWIPVNANVS